KPLTAAQQARLKERDRYAAQAEKLWRAGKQAEAIAAWEQKLAIEREVFGEAHEEVAESLEQLAGLHEAREDFPAARKVRREVLALRSRLHGEKDWRVTDARLALENTEHRARLDANSRQRLRQASELNRQVLSLWKQGRSREALPLAQQAAEIRRQT